MMWIQSHKDGPIPDELKYPDWQTDKDNYG